MIAGCDPVSLMDANIENSTSQQISITLISSISPNETVVIGANETVLFREGMSTTGSFLKPSFAEYDSIYFESESNEILRVFKPDSQGKNIYEIDDYWRYSEPSKRFYQYDYQINSDDFE